VPYFSKLYKYKTIDRFFDELIEKSELFFSSGKNLNDPYESILRFTNIQELVDDGDSPNKSIKIEQEIKQYSEGIYYFCMSKTNDDIRMWSHYGDNHRGVCLEFDFNINIEEPQLCYHNHKIYQVASHNDIPLLCEVNYSNKLDEFAFAPDGDLNLSSEQIDCFGFNKFKCWEYENVFENAKG